MEAVFEGLADSGALDSVWTYNQPVSHKDYIVDPGEGLWDEPGWERYVPETMYRAGRRVSRLPHHPPHPARQHRLPGEAEGWHLPARSRSSGKPVPGHHRWAPGAYNLAGFPLLPGAGATVATMKTARRSLRSVR